MQPDSLLPTLGTHQWRDDLRFFARELVQRHKNPYHLVTQNAFEEAVATLYARIPTLSNSQVVVGIARLAAMIGDGHTRLEMDDLLHCFPFEAFRFGRELRVVRTIPEHRQILGARIVGIGKLPITEVYKRLRALIPQGENRWYSMHQSARQITRVETLAALEILPGVDTAQFAFADESGQIHTLSMQPCPAGASMEWIDAAVSPPLHLQRRDEGFWCTDLPESRTVYVNFRRYDDLAEHAQRLWAVVDKAAPTRLIIDMRQNAGGDYTLGREHLVYPTQFRRTINRRGHLFVVTGRETFSAGMTNAIDFHRETDAILVGEPMGARPNGYQEVDRFLLPNSRLPVSCSIAYYRFQDRDLAAFSPEIRIDPDWRLHRAGRDPVLEWIDAHPSMRR